jgi:hypothetical protein
MPIYEECRTELLRSSRIYKRHGFQAAAAEVVVRVVSFSHFWREY